MPDALPSHVVTVDGFWMDSTPITNAQFEKFVAGTRYVTVAERPLNASDFPGVPADKLVPGSAVFRATADPVPLDNPLRWWHYTAGASWQRPEGPGSTTKGREDHPGRQACAKRSGIRVCRTRRSRSKSLLVGQRAQTWEQARVEHLAGDVSGARSG
jgi:hypothetical protein